MKQTEGIADISLSFRKKIELVKMLDKLGVSVIECAPLKNKKQDSLSIKSLSSAVKSGCLAVPVDIDDADGVSTAWNALKDAVNPRLQVFIPVSTVQMEYFCHRKPTDILELTSAKVAECAALNNNVEFIAGDFTRSDEEFLSQVVEAAVKAGASVITVQDAAGDLFPDEFGKKVAAVRKLLPEKVSLGVWCSNGMYMADADAIAALRCGADEIKTTPYGNTTVSLKRLSQILSTRPDLCGESLPVKGTEVLRTVSQIKNLCEVKKKDVPVLFPPDKSLEDTLLSVSDDRQSVAALTAKLGYDLSEEDKDRVYETFSASVSEKGTMTAKELDAIVASVAFQAPVTYRLEDYVITSGNTISASCQIRLRKKEDVLEGVCLGSGPIDAAFKAIDSLVGRRYELDDFQIRAVAEGSKAMGETIVRLRCNGKLFSGRGISINIVSASIMAYLNAVNKIEFEEAGE